MSRKRTVHQNETFDFLKDIVAKVPDPVEGEGRSTAEGDGRGAKRRKVEKKEEEEEDEEEIKEEKDEEESE